MKVIDPIEFSWETADPQTFDGEARVWRLGGSETSDKVLLYRVEFSPGARTYWHEHTGLQLLLVLQGVCLVQKWGEPMIQVRPGASVLIESGEKHWHGAGDETVTHLAANVNATTRWLERVES